ncbi:MAG: ParB/RepB/Spo0J family partition protein [Actinomycetota bacterium]|nr:ParB/RepB/Spo0J family partition protein [Actinomycetota bacterium]
MADKTRGMGRGLAAILAVSDRAGDESDELRSLPLDLIEPSPHQPRGRFDEEALQALAESLRARGVIQPILVRPATGGRYELIAGERRWRAARLADLEEIPALVRAHDDATALEVALIENMVREDLNVLDQARACAALIEEMGLTREDVGRRVGRSRVSVSNLLRLLDLPDEALALLEAGELSEGHGRALLLAADHEDRRRLAGQAAEGGWSVRETESRARRAQPTGARAKGGRVIMHPDQEAALESLAETFTEALGTQARVVARGTGCRVEMTFSDLGEAREIIARLAARRAA